MGNPSTEDKIQMPELRTLRFPIIFGSILAMFYTGFTYRKSFMTDLPERKIEMNQEDSKNKTLIRQSIRSINQERRRKIETIFVQIHRNHWYLDVKPWPLLLELHKQF